MKPLRIAIIGAGTAGLAAANLLARQSHHISLYEKAESLAPVGAGLLLQPSGLAVFQKLGVLGYACELGAPVAGLIGKLPSGKKIVNSFYEEAHPEQFGLGIHRASLCHILSSSLDDLPISWYMGYEITDVQQQNNEAVITFKRPHDDNETKQTQTTSKKHKQAYDLVLICNGARSAMRPAQWTLLDKAYPWGAVWTIVPECQVLEHNVLHQFYDGASVMMGVLPTGRLPPTQSQTAIKTNPEKLSSVFWSLPSTELKQMTSLEKTQRISIETRKRWSKVADWLDTLPTDSQWLDANYRDVVMRQYGEGNIGVLGDAAHAMSPQLGQGANMALLDAWAISEAIAKAGIAKGSDVHEIWQHYHTLRSPSIRFYQRMSRLLTPFYQSHSAGLGKLRDVTFSWMYYFPWLRKQMALTISGVKTGLLSEVDLKSIRDD